MCDSNARRKSVFVSCELFLMIAKGILQGICEGLQREGLSRLSGCHSFIQCRLQRFEELRKIGRGEKSSWPGNTTLGAHHSEAFSGDLDDVIWGGDGWEGFTQNCLQCTCHCQQTDHDYCSREHPENITRGPVARFDTGVWHATLAGQECSTRASEIASWLHVLSHQRIEKLLGLLVVPVGGSERACNVDHWQCSTHMPIHMPWWYVCICASLFEGDPSNNQKASVQLLLRVIDL